MRRRLRSLYVREQKADAAALEQVVHAYLPQLLRAARGAGLAPELAEDVAQDTFVTFIETAPRFEGRSHVRTWLFGILYKKIAAARRDARYGLVSICAAGAMAGAFLLERS